MESGERQRRTRVTGTPPSAPHDRCYSAASRPVSTATTARCVTRCGLATRTRVSRSTGLTRVALRQVRQPKDCDSRLAGRDAPTVYARVGGPEMYLFRGERAWVVSESRRDPRPQGLLGHTRPCGHARSGATRCRCDFEQIRAKLDEGEVPPARAAATAAHRVAATWRTPTATGGAAGRGVGRGPGVAARHRLPGRPPGRVRLARVPRGRGLLRLHGARPRPAHLHRGALLACARPFGHAGMHTIPDEIRGPIFETALRPNPTTTRPR